MGNVTLTILREFRSRFYEITNTRVYGIPVDKVLHFSIGGLVFAIAAKLWGNRAACWVLAVAMIAKEIVDYFLKSSLAYIRAPTSERIADTVEDILFGVAGGLTVWLWQRWRARRTKAGNP